MAVVDDDDTFGNIGRRQHWFTAVIMALARLAGGGVSGDDEMLLLSRLPRGL